jgi:3-deoxy-D-manno-octulosonic-acid transferase
MTNWAADTEALVEADGLAVVEAPWDLPAVITPLLADNAAAKAMGERGRRAAAEAGSGLDRLWETLAPLLPPAAPPAGPGRGRR